MGKEALKFRAEGTFTIVQFTDLHWQNKDKNDLRTFALMDQVLTMELPDLVVFTGDIIQSENCLDPLTSFLQATEIVEQFKVPWAAVFGNHDDEKGITREELMQLQKQSEFCLSKPGPAEIKGVGNYVLEVKDSIGDKLKAGLYFLDSGSYCRTSLGGYDWIDHSQIGWYLEQSKQFYIVNNKALLPSLAFFHIPLPEYNEMWNYSLCYGHNFEEICCPKANSGLFAAFLERGDILGVFVGHDHINDFWGELHGIKLCYGRATGYNTYGKDGFQRGARVIQLSTNERGFETWLRLEDGSKIEQQPRHEPQLIRKRME